MNEDILAIGGFFVTSIILGIGIPLVLAYNKRKERQAALPHASPEVIARLERMEQAIDSIAVEVERISEGQRFTTKLLSEQPGAERARVLPPREPGA